MPINQFKDKPEIKLNRADGFETTVEEIQNDCTAASLKNTMHNTCFSWVTVQSLLDKIAELSQPKDDAS